MVLVGTGVGVAAAASQSRIDGLFEVRCAPLPRSQQFPECSASCDVCGAVDRAPMLCRGLVHSPRWVWAGSALALEQPKFEQGAPVLGGRGAAGLGGELVGRFEAVLDQQVEVVTLVEHLDL